VLGYQEIVGISLPYAGKKVKKSIREVLAKANWPLIKPQGIVDQCQAYSVLREYMNTSTASR
jgi:hypothetical protein